MATFAFSISDVQKPNWRQMDFTARNEYDSHLRIITDVTRSTMFPTNTLSLAV
jgi:hypothetical protein